MKIKLTQLWFLVFSLFLGQLTLAHQQKEAYTEILFNSRTNNLEVFHSFYLHDAEHVIAKLFNAKADMIRDAGTQKQFADYIQRHFQLQDDKNNRLSLNLLGHEIDGKYFVVYQEMEQTEPFDYVLVKMDALQEIWPSQINHINLEIDGRIRSVRINKSKTWNRVDLRNIPE